MPVIDAVKIDVKGHTMSENVIFVYVFIVNNPLPWRALLHVSAYLNVKSSILVKSRYLSSTVDQITPLSSAPEVTC